MNEILSKAEYEAMCDASRDRRMKWWREARYGMFVHFGLFSLLGRNEWSMALENWDVADYEKLADSFRPRPGAPREWAKLAKEAGMKYMVMTTRHHEGFSLWDSKANPYNSVNLGPKRDIVREFVDACREFDLKIGFYSSLMDWHHPDGWKCASDPAARKRFLRYIEDLNTELLTNYGKIDILWYDVPRPLADHEAWDSVARNQRLRKLQPDIIINNRSRLDEDFGTPEEHLTAENRDWEACMTFNGISWGYVDPVQAAPYNYTPQQIVRMLHSVTSKGGNLLLNIGPAPDGSVPPDAVGPLRKVGAWLRENGRAVYGKKDKTQVLSNFVNGLSYVSQEGDTIYLWNWIWPKDRMLIVGGDFGGAVLRDATMLRDNSKVEFEQRGARIFLRGLPEKSPDETLGIAVFALRFDRPVKKIIRCSNYPQANAGI